MRATRQKNRLYRPAMNSAWFHLDPSRRLRFAMTAVIMAATLQQPTALLAATSTAATQPTQEMEEIIVTGQALPGAVLGDIPPENQLSPRDIASYGVSTINDLLNEIANQTQSDQGRDSSSGPIILVNGKRVSGVNEVGDFPTESILRVDILPEEVALKYGYDAQQKVVNIILRRNFQAKVTNVGGSASTEGGGENGTGDLSYTRIHDNDRINVVARVKAQAALKESDRGVSSTADTVSDPDGTIVNDSDARTLKPATRTYSLNGVLAHPLSDTITSSFNAQASYQTSRALDGYPTAVLEVPANSPYALSDDDTTIDRYLSNSILHQDVDTAKAHAGVTLNADLPKMWRLSVIGAYDYSDARTRTDRGYDVSELQAAIDAGEIDPYGSLSSSNLGSLRRQNAEAITNTGSASILANGKLFALPAGDIGTSIKLGGDVSSLDSSSTGNEGKTVSRTKTNAQISVDVPLTSRSKQVLGAMGDLSANFTGAITDVSNYGVLGTFGYGVHWTPHTGISLIASINEDRQAPSLDQLNGPTITTSNVRLYDAVQGTTVTVSQITGGNPDLKADDRHVFKFGASLAPISTANLKLNLTADYLHSVTHNSIGSLGSATAVTEAAFPDRFERDEDGVLISVDNRAVNFDREDREELRWGFNLTKVLRAPTRPIPALGARGTGARNRRPADDQSGTESGPRPAAGGAQNRTATTAGSTTDQSTANSQNDGREEVVVTGQQANGGEAIGPSPSRDGMGRPDGMADGPPSEGFTDRMNGPRPGSGGGRQGARGGAGGGNGAQLQISLYHTWYFRDEVRLNADGPTLDLLNGGTTGSRGQARHQLQLNAGVMDNGIGLRLSGNWTAPTTTLNSGDGSGALFYSSLATVDLRLFADLQQRFMGKAWARGTRVTLAVGNVFSAHQDVHDASGATPQIYQPAFVDPYGRTASISIRRLF